MATTPPPAEVTGLENYTALVIAMEVLASSGVVGSATDGPLGDIRTFVASGRPVTSPVLPSLRFTKNATSVEGIHEVVVDALRRISQKTHSAMSVFGSSRRRARVQDVTATVGMWQGRSVEPCIKALIGGLGIDDPASVKFV